MRKICRIILMLLSVALAEEVLAVVKKDGGGTRQVIHLGEQIESVYFEWEGEAKVDAVHKSEGMVVYVNVDDKIVEVYGEPKDFGLHSVVLRFTNAEGVMEQEVQVQVIDYLVPVVSLAAKSGKASQDVPVGCRLDTIRLAIENADSVYMAECPEGIGYGWDENYEYYLVYDRLREKGVHNIMVTAMNGGMQTDFPISIASAGSREKKERVMAFGEIDVEDIDGISVYDLNGVLVKLVRTVDEIRELESGLYVMVVRCENQVYTYKVAVGN